MHQPRVEAFEDGKNMRSMSLKGARYFIVGRNGAQADIVVADPSVSRAQAAIINSSTATFIADLDSAHGTWLDTSGRTLAIPQLGERLDPNGEPVQLTEGATLRFGTFAKTVFRIVGLSPPKVERWAPPAWCQKPDGRSLRLEVRSNTVSNPYLSHLGEDGAGVDEYLPLATQCTAFGRSAAHADVVLRDESISRQHAAIVHTDDESFLIDLGSAAGSFVDGKRAPANKPLALRDGSVISLGESPATYTFRAANEGAAAANATGKRKRALGGGPR